MSGALLSLWEETPNVGSDRRQNPRPLIACLYLGIRKPDHEGRALYAVRAGEPTMCGSRSEGQPLATRWHPSRKALLQRRDLMGFQMDHGLAPEYVDLSLDSGRVVKLCDLGDKIEECAFRDLHLVAGLVR